MAASSLVTHTNMHGESFLAYAKTVLLLLEQLTVEIASQQLQAESRLQHVANWLNSDVASHKRWRKSVFFHLVAVQVTMKNLQQSHRNRRALT